MKSIKKTLALLIAAAMIATSAAIPALAEDVDTAAEEAVVEVLDVEEEEAVDEEAEEAATEDEAVEEETEEIVELFDEEETGTADTELPEADKYGVITLKNNVELSSAQTISGTLDLNGYSITGSVSKLITVASDTSLTIQDTSDAGDGSITSSAGYTVYSNGTLTITGGTITGDYAVYLNTDSTATISGGTITGTSYGVYIKAAKLEMTGGEIFGKTGVGLASGAATATISGGTVRTTGTSSSFSAIVLSATASVLTIKDDAVIGSSEDKGNGIEVKTGTVYVTGGTITGGNHYGIYVSGTNTCTVNITGGTITGAATTSTDDDGNEVTEYSSGVYVKGSTSKTVTATISGGTITGSVLSTNYSEVTISGDASVTDVTSQNNGTIEITGGSASGTVTATGTGTVTVSGGEVTNIESTNGGTVYVTGGTVTGTVEADDDSTIEVIGGEFTGEDVDVSEYTTGNSYVNDDGDITSVSDTVGDDATAGTNQTVQTAEATPTPEDEATDSVMITGNAVTKAYAVAAKTKVESLTSASATDITYSRLDEVTSYTSADGVVSMNIEPYIVYTYTASGKSDSTTVKEVLSLTGVEASVSIPVGGSLSGKVAVKHTMDSGEIEYKSGTVSNGYVTVTTTNGFSYWEVYGDSAQTITVQFEQYVDDQGDEVKGKYNINLVGDGEIYRFMAAELQFSFEVPTTGSVGYEINAVDNIELVTSTDSSGTVTYGFNVDGNTYSSLSADSGEAITIGTVTFVGVSNGNFTFELDTTDADNNKVQTAVGSQALSSSDNNIVRTYLTSGDTDSVLACETLTESISVDTTRLCIYVMFPNLVEAQNSTYTSMKVAYSNIQASREMEFGSEKTTSTPYAEYDTTNGWYGYRYYVTVPRNYATSLEFSGEGYRTYRTSITPTGETATITVWNNAMSSNETVVIAEDDNAMGSVKTDVTFLAGDIVANNVIDLWDLSAVVSYFGKGDMTSYSDISEVEDYIKYDLNRDGKIDSRDIAMVLVSWNK